MAAGLVLVSSRFRGLLAVRVPAVRALVPGPVPVQTRTFALKPDSDQNLDQNPFFSKYREKIQALRSSNPQEYEARMERRSELKQQKVGHSQQGEFIKLLEQTKKERGEATSSGPSGVCGRHKSLESILNLDLVQDKTGPEISQIWNQYFSSRDTISAVIPAETFEKIQTRAQTCPMFLCALPRSDGYEFFVGQWSGLELHFTSLINLQTVGESAPSQLVLVHYPELKQKDIVLMTAERDRSAMDVAEAQCLANQVQLFYGSRNGAFRLVEAFNHHPAEFKHMDVIAELEQSGVVTETQTSV